MYHIHNVYSEHLFSRFIQLWIDLLNFWTRFFPDSHELLSLACVIVSAKYKGFIFVPSDREQLK